MIQQIICSFVGTIAFSIMFNVSRRFYVYCGLTGVAGWVTYCLLVSHISPALATFFGTIIVVLLSRIFAVWRKCPITVFLISGILPLVPGTYVYYTAYHFVRDNLGMAVDKGIMALKLAFAIVLGIVFIVSIPRQFFSVQYWKDRRKKNKVVT